MAKICLLHSAREINNEHSLFMFIFCQIENLYEENEQREIPLSSTKVYNPTD